VDYRFIKKLQTINKLTKEKIKARQTSHTQLKVAKVSAFFKHFKLN
jgi:hypothetical protein